MSFSPAAWKATWVPDCARRAGASPGVRRVGGRNDNGAEVRRSVYVPKRGYRDTPVLLFRQECAGHKPSQQFAATSSTGKLWKAQPSSHEDRARALHKTSHETARGGAQRGVAITGRLSDRAARGAGPARERGLCWAEPSGRGPGRGAGAADRTSRPWASSEEGSTGYPASQRSGANGFVYKPRDGPHNEPGGRRST